MIEVLMRIRVEGDFYPDELWSVYRYSQFFRVTLLFYTFITSSSGHMEYLTILALKWISTPFKVKI